ncbi:MAG: hypothetical protein Q8M08_16600 [Bacteroidales bacterium]|nr:hypothetical protein [Bacteroidales bacterium]
MMRLLLTTFCFLPLLFSCKSTQYTPKNYKGSQIIAGSSGGVTGMMKEYILLDNGHLFLSKGLTGEWKEVRKLKKSKTREIFKKAEILGLSTVKFKHPGNMTYYLNLKQPPRSNEIKWGESGISPPEGISEFYNYLLSNF